MSDKIPNTFAIPRAKPCGLITRTTGAVVKAAQIVTSPSPKKGGELSLRVLSRTHNFVFEKVPAHSGVVLNEMADSLANQASHRHGRTVNSRPEIDGSCYCVPEQGHADLFNQHSDAGTPATQSVEPNPMDCLHQ